MISYFMLIHIGSPEGVTLLEFEEEAEENQEIPQPAAPEGEELASAELSECPNHQPTSFLKGKPRSIISLLYFVKGKPRTLNPMLV